MLIKTDSITTYCRSGHGIKRRKSSSASLSVSLSLMSDLDPIMNWGVVEYFEDEQRRSYLLYRCESSDEYSGWVHIVDLESGKRCQRSQLRKGACVEQKRVRLGILHPVHLQRRQAACKIGSHMHTRSGLNVASYRA